jgi:uncharacterized protein (DUF1778 family)
MPAETKNDARLDFRLNSQAKELIERAAALNGKSVSDFATSTLLEKARQVVQAETTRTLTEKDARLFLAMLDDERPNAALKRAARRYKARRHG